MERSNIRGREDLSIYDSPDTPRFYPGGTPESAGEAHRRLHEATRDEGIKLRGGNAGMTDQQLLDHYASAYSNPSLDHIIGDLRTPNGSTIIATNVTPSQAYAALIEWGRQQNTNN